MFNWCEFFFVLILEQSVARIEQEQGICRSIIRRLFPFLYREIRFQEASGFYETIKTAIQT